MFYSIRTAEKDHISRIYKKIKEQVKADLKDRTSELSKIIRNPLAVKYWEKILRKEKNPRAVDFLCVSAMQYLTEIVRLISS